MEEKYMSITNNFTTSTVSKYTTFKELGQLWLFTKKERLKQSTYLKYCYLLDQYIYPEIGNYVVHSLKNPEIDTAIYQIYWKKKKEHLSCSLMKSIIFITNSVLSYGTRLQIIPHLEITFEVPRLETAELMVFSDSDLKILLESLKATPSDNSLGILLSLYTGLRIGEICALQRNDIDFEKKILHIRKTVQRLRQNQKSKTELVISNPKSAKSYRDIPIPDFLLVILKEYNIAELETYQYILGKKTIPYEPRTLQYGYQRILEKCNIKYLNFHCLRHTFATNCVKSGFDIKTLSEILGHSNVNFTMNRYVHSDIEQKRRQMNLLNEYMF